MRARPYTAAGKDVSAFTFTNAPLAEDSAAASMIRAVRMASCKVVGDGPSLRIAARNSRKNSSPAIPPYEVDGGIGYVSSRCARPPGAGGLSM